MISICLPSLLEGGARGRWSAAVGIVELGEATLKLSQPPTLAGGEGSAGPVEPPSPLVLRVEVTMVGATVLVHLSPHDRTTPPPYRLINRTSTPVYCNQVRDGHSNPNSNPIPSPNPNPNPSPNQAGVAAVTTRVPPHGSAAYV